MEKMSFYFSNEQFRVCKNIALSDISSHRPTYRFFKGKPYTECRPVGKKPIGKFNDYVHVGDGFYHECEFK